MPSRKRNKGKERKAKKAEQEVERIENERALTRELWQGWALGQDMYIQDSGRIITRCNHGCVLMIPNDNHPVTSFMDAFFMKCFFSESKSIVDVLSDSFDTHRAVWNDDSHRNMISGLMLGIGTNMILGNDVNALGLPRNIAYAVVVLENYDGSGDIHKTMRSRVVASKYRDGLGGSGSVRDVLKFYRKRLSCSCLKKMHLEARKTTPKMGACLNCGQKKERALLSVCSKCRISHYCSRECQIEDWPEHRGHCDIMCDAHQRRRQNDF